MHNERYWTGAYVVLLYSMMTVAVWQQNVTVRVAAECDGTCGCVAAECDGTCGCVAGECDGTCDCVAGECDGTCGCVAAECDGTCDCVAGECELYWKKLVVCYSRNCCV